MLLNTKVWQAAARTDFKSAEDIQLQQAVQCAAKETLET